MKFFKKIFSLNDLMEILLLCAFSMLFEQFFVIDLNNDGWKLTFSFIPLIILGIRHGLIKGFIFGGGVAGTFMWLMSGTSGYNYTLSYLLAFGILAITGTFRTNILYPLYGKKKNYVPTTKDKIMPYIYMFIGSFLACFLMFMFKVLNYMIVDGISANEGAMNALKYMLPSSIVTIVVMVAITYPLIQYNKKNPVVKPI